ncbi:unnamed protein product [Amoebophrya sp. A25]|nr:unnamed protein product [Amoebophrya sp. A25]|eukprot:GSA25T00008186001.1
MAVLQNSTVQKSSSQLHSSRRLSSVRGRLLSAGKEVELGPVATALGEWDGTDSYYGSSIMLRFLFVVGVLMQIAATVLCFIVWCRSNGAPLFLGGARAFSYMTMIAALGGGLIVLWKFDTHLGLYYCCLSLGIMCLAFVHFLDLHILHRGYRLSVHPVATDARLDILFTVLGNGLGGVVMAIIRHDHHKNVRMFFLEHYSTEDDNL